MKMTHIFVLFAFFLSGICTVSAQDNAKVNWIDFEKAVEKQAEVPKKIFVDVYTDWCGWCRRMDADTYSHPVVAAYLNDNYYPVKLNAEHKEPITFQGVVFENQNPEGRRHAHDLAAALLQGKMGYPSIVLIDEESNIITSIPGFKQAIDMEYILYFFHNDIYKDTSWEDFQAGFESQIRTE